MHAIVLDTNILIQGNLERIKENADKYQFIVPLVVLEELDKLKSDVSIGNDVRKAINWIDANLAFLKFELLFYLHS